MFWERYFAHLSKLGFFKLRLMPQFFFVVKLFNVKLRFFKLALMLQAFIFFLMI